MSNITVNPSAAYLHAEAGSAGSPHAAVVIGVELPGFAKRPVAEQLSLREKLHRRLTDALRNIPHGERIVLDTSNGIAIALLGSTSSALVVASILCREEHSDSGKALSVRAALTVGPLQALSLDKGEIQIAGDALDVAERVAALVANEKVVATRSFLDALQRDAPDCTAALQFIGAFTDEQVREHELYAINLGHGSILALGKEANRAKPSRRRTSVFGPAQRFAVGGAAVGLCALLMSSLLGFGHSSLHNVQEQTEVAPRPHNVVAPPAEARKEITESKTIDLGKSEASFETEVIPANTEVDEKAVKPAPIRHPHTSGVASHTSALPSYGTQIVEASIETKEVLPEVVAERGRIILAIAPWGEVFVDGKSVGISPPLTELELSAGSHYVEVRNGASQPVLRRVDVQTNETLKIRHRFADSR